jgi:hypothetical protein
MSAPVHKLSIAQAASAIRDLVNASPTSPSQSEIEAILAKVAIAAEARRTLTSTAEEIAALYVLRDAMERGLWAQNKRPEEKPWVDFEGHRDAADARISILQDLVLELEPQSVDDALSLVLQTSEAFDTFATNHTEEAPADSSVTTEWQALTRAFTAVARWLHRSGARSPLVKTHFREDRLATPPSDQIATALARERELAAQASACAAVAP